MQGQHKTLSAGMKKTKENEKCEWDMYRAGQALQIEVAGPN